MNSSPGIMPLSSYIASCRGLHAIVTLHLVDEEGDDPACDEETDDAVAEQAEIVAHIGDEAPERPLQGELVADEAKRFDAADHQRGHHRHEGDRHVVIKLPDRPDESPTI